MAFKNHVFSKYVGLSYEQKAVVLLRLCYYLAFGHFFWFPRGEKDFEDVFHPLRSVKNIDKNL